MTFEVGDNVVMLNSMRAGMNHHKSSERWPSLES